MKFFKHCPDGKECDVTVNIENQYDCKCRHGVVPATDSEDVNLKGVIIVSCPLKLQKEQISKEWDRFFKDLPNIKKSIARYLKSPRKVKL